MVPSRVRQVPCREIPQRRGVRRSPSARPYAVLRCDRAHCGLSKDAAPSEAADAAGQFHLGQDKRKENMKTEYIFPTVLIALDVAASIPYAAKCNWRMMVYWLAAATLTACVTYTGGKA